ncbi:MAG: L,D-transpeptidase family protein [Gammaproteobacteria bacterium]|nr:L,D-transpeptidase family protein [Gammaproteobacteria bacterium]
MPMGKVRIILLLLVFSPAWLFAHDLVSQIIPANNIDHHYETMLINALENIKDNQLNLALADLKHLVKVKPDFKLAQLIYADLLLARSRPIRDFGNYSELHHEYISALRDEARARWQHHLAPPDEDKIPEFLVQLSNEQEYVITVDLHASRLYLFQNHKGIPRLISDFYVSIGKNGIGKYEEGDQKTPIGVYFVEGFIDPDQLPDFYGDGAFPIDYPNVWDKRQNRTGYGIWLHGTPADTYSRPPRDSDGCVILSNQDLNTLSPYLQAGKTPVLLAQDIKWISVEEWQASQRDYMQFIEQWRSDWESRDVELYLRHYAKDYSGLGKDYKSWVEYKRHVTPSKSFIRVNISDTSMFLYPGEPGVLVVTFDQDYQSDNVHRRFVKRQYWRRDRDGKWKIVYEGSVS